MTIRVLTLSDQAKDILKERILRYEDRYEMSSSEMVTALSNGSERETAEKLEWMFDYHVLESMIEEQTLTTGTPGTDTSSSTRSVSVSIGS